MFQYIIAIPYEIRVLRINHTYYDVDHICTFNYKLKRCSHTDVERNRITKTL